MKKISRPSLPIVSGNTALASTPRTAANTSFSVSATNAFSSPVRGEIYYEEATIPAQYPFRLSLYTRSPTYEIAIEDFEELALARLERKTRNFLFLSYF